MRATEAKPHAQTEQLENKYTLDWFKRRAFESLKPLGDGKWDYSDSLLLYLPSAANEYESLQEKDDPYARLVTKPERTYLQSIANQVVAELPNEFDYVDLGPGTAHKEQFIFDVAHAQDKKLHYVPVDINNRYLAMASEYATAQQIPTHPIQSPFEELPTRISSVRPHFVSLGLTFSNYNPKDIFPLLTSIAGKNGHIFVDVQVRERSDMQRLTEMYGRDVRGVSDPKIPLLGLDVESDISDRTTDDGIRMWYTLRKSNPELEQCGIHAGDKLLMFQSLRYTKKSFEKLLSSTFSKYTLLDTGSEFLGAVIQP